MEDSKLFVVELLTGDYSVFLACCVLVIPILKVLVVLSLFLLRAVLASGDSR